MKYRDTYRIVTQVSRYVSHRDFRYRATPNHQSLIVESLVFTPWKYAICPDRYLNPEPLDWRTVYLYANHETTATLS